MTRRVLKQQLVGEHVRRLRTRRGLSVRTLATRGGFSPSFISQVELGQASPSIDSMQRIAEVLDVTLGEFFAAAAAAEAPRSRVVRRPDRQVLRSGWSKATIEALSTAAASIEAVIIVLAPGGRSGKLPHGHGMDQFAFVLEGRAALSLGNQDHVLRVEDSVTVPAGEPTLWRNHGKRRARVLFVSVQPLIRRSVRVKARPLR